MGKKLDQRSDIYSFGCILYEAVAGVPPHRGETMIETIFKHLNDTPKALHEARPDISFPQAFEDLSMKLLANKPEDRFQSISEVKKRLLAIQAGALKGSHVIASKPRFNLKVSRPTAALVIGATLALVGVVSLAMSSESLRRAQHLKVEQERKPVEIPNNFATSPVVGLSRPVVRQSNSAADATYEGLSQLNPNQEEVDLTKSKVSDGALFALTRLTQLHLLKLSETKITDQAVTPLLRLRTLTKLYLNGTDLTPSALNKLASLPNLREVYLDNTAANDSTLLALSKLPELSALEVRDTPITDKGLEYLRKAKNLTWLSISGTNVTNRGMAIIGQMNLTDLALWDTNVSSGGLEKLSDCKTLTRLTLSRLRLSTGDLNALSRLSNLQEIQLYHINNLKNDDLKYFTKLKSLSRFYVEDCPLTDGAADYLTQMPQMTGLALNRTKITDQTLVRIGNLKQLENLWIEETQITDAGLKVLSKLENLGNLYMSGTLVTDAGLKELASSPKLDYVEARFCPNISRRGVVAYSESHPNGSIVLHYTD